MTGAELALLLQGLQYGGKKIGEIRAGQDYERKLKQDIQGKVNAGVLTPEEAQYEYLSKSRNPALNRIAEKMRPMVESRALQKIDTAMELQNEATRKEVNRQLQESLKQIGGQYAQSGVYRTGARMAREDELRGKAMEAIGEATAKTALQAEALKANISQFNQEYNLKLAQLELAKKAGDVELMSSISEQLAPYIFQRLLTNPTGKGVEPTDISSEAMESYLYGEQSVPTAKPEVEPVIPPATPSPLPTPVYTPEVNPSADIEETGTDLDSLILDMLLNLGGSGTTGTTGTTTDIDLLDPAVWGLE